MNTIVYCDDLKEDADEFQNKWLGPYWSTLGATSMYHHVAYAGPGGQILKPKQIAIEVHKYLAGVRELGKAVFLIDLCPTSCSDAAYGLNVILELARIEGLNLIQLLERQDYLVAITSRFLADVEAPLKSLPEWRSSINRIKQLRSSVHMHGNLHDLKARVADEAQSIVSKVLSPGGRILVSEKETDALWLAQVTVKWLSR